MSQGPEMPLCRLEESGNDPHGTLGNSLDTELNEILRQGSGNVSRRATQKILQASQGSLCIGYSTLLL